MEVKCENAETIEASSQEVFVKPKVENTKKDRKNQPQSSIRGVYYVKSGNYWIAEWHDENGNRKSKTFSVKKYGDVEAREMAEKARKDINALMNMSKQNISNETETDFETSMQSSSDTTIECPNETVNDTLLSLAPDILSKLKEQIKAEIKQEMKETQNKNLVIPTSDVRGVSYQKRSDGDRWVVQLVDKDGKRQRKYFGVKKFGVDGGRKMAEDFKHNSLN